VDQHSAPDSVYLPASSWSFHRARLTWVGCSRFKRKPFKSNSGH